MKKKTGKMVLLTGVLCILSLAVCACGKKEDAAEPQVVQGEPIPEDDTKEEDATPEPSEETGGTEDEDKLENPGAEPAPESGENRNQGTDSTQKEQPEAQPEAQSTSGTSAQWVDSTPNLEGDAKDLKDGQLTVVEFVTEQADNGGDIIVSPGIGGMIRSLTRLPLHMMKTRCLPSRQFMTEGPGLKCQKRQRQTWQPDSISRYGEVLQAAV